MAFLFCFSNCYSNIEIINLILMKALIFNIFMTDSTDYFCIVMLSRAAGVNLVSLVGCWSRICLFFNLMSSEILCKAVTVFT